MPVKTSVQIYGDQRVLTAAVRVWYVGGGESFQVGKKLAGECGRDRLDGATD